MKIKLIFLSVFLLPLVVSAQELPKRKPGLWQIAIQHDGQAVAAAASEHCLDEATDSKMMNQGMGMSKEMCKKFEMKTVASNIITDSECDIAGSNIVSHGEVSGDFNSKYTITTKSKYSPPLMGKSESTSTVTATWIGQCKSDQKPGDIIMANGHKINIDTIMKGAGSIMKK